MHTQYTDHDHTTTSVTEYDFFHTLHTSYPFFNFKNYQCNSTKIDHLLNTSHPPKVNEISSNYLTKPTFRNYIHQSQNVSADLKKAVQIRFLCPQSFTFQTDHFLFQYQTVFDIQFPFVQNRSIFWKLSLPTPFSNAAFSHPFISCNCLSAQIKYKFIFKKYTMNFCFLTVKKKINNSIKYFHFQKCLRVHFRIKKKQQSLASPIFDKLKLFMKTNRQLNLEKFEKFFCFIFLPIATKLNIWLEKKGRKLRNWFDEKRKLLNGF